MTFSVSSLTLLPDAFPGSLGVSILERARQNGIWRHEVVPLREFGVGKHKDVDDTPAGGGAGMVMRADIAAAAIDSIERNNRPLIYPSPRGVPFSQQLARKWSEGPGLVILCGRFEGLDERVIEARKMTEVSLGDFVLAGGEVAAQAMIEATVRLLPGVAGNSESIADESFENGLLEYPLYTRPRIWENREIPEVLLSGDHGKIKEWRESHSKELTQDRRPDLWAAYPTGPLMRASETDDEHH
ncbi:MAG: tRNA (guanosine(37)-N1)-methyltransferase TrmD [Pseudomonadota bacterium]